MFKRRQVNTGKGAIGCLTFPACAERDCAKKVPVVHGAKRLDLSMSQVMDPEGCAYPVHDYGLITE